MGFGKRYFQNPAAAFLRDDAFSCFGFGEVADLDDLKGDFSRPSDLMTLSKSKNLRFFSCFGFGEVADLDDLKGGFSRPSDLITLSMVNVHRIQHYTSTTGRSHG